MHNSKLVDLKVVLLAGVVLLMVSTNSLAQPPPGAPTAPLKIDLAGTWKFGLDFHDTGLTYQWHTPNFNDYDFRDIQVPGYWEDQGNVDENRLWTKDTENKPYSGYAWYRRHIVVPANWRAQPVWLVIGAIDDYDWVYFNGYIVGHTGEETKDACTMQRNYAIPSDYINYGADNTIAIRVCDISGKGGIWKGPVILSLEQVAPPVALIAPPQPPAVPKIEKPSIVKILSDIEVPLNTRIKGDVVAIAGKVDVAGEVTGNVVAIGRDVNLASTAVVAGDVVSVGAKINRELGSQVKGKEVAVGVPFFPLYGIPWGELRRLGLISIPIAGAILKFIGFATIAVLLLLLIPRRIAVVSAGIAEAPGWSFLLGIVAALLVAPVTLILVLTIIGIPLVVVEVVFIIVAFLIGYVGLSLLVGQKLIRMIHWETKTAILATILGLIIFELLNLIPYIDGIVGILVFLISLGGVLWTAFGSDVNWWRKKFGHKPPPEVSQE